MLKIWGRVNSVNVKKALWAAEELGLKYQRIDAGMEHGVNSTPEYRRMNPTGLVPTIEDDGFTLWESHTIVRYLAARHGAGSLWPTDVKARADADRWMDWTHSFSREFQRPVFWPLVRTPPEKRDAKAIAEAVRKCADMLGIVDAALADRKYLGGSQLTESEMRERPRLPNLEAWFTRLCERAPYRKIVDIALS
ncbi:MAG: glutathione S-transferase [Betaproteobacteria bacterium]|nr:MAG: glutathione S-transferase [Betaproteobacteria bacterium]